jgi:hypothetical protein
MQEHQLSTKDVTALVPIDNHPQAPPGEVRIVVTRPAPLLIAMGVTALLLAIAWLLVTRGG